jgi:hypothetical protein
LSIIEEDDSSSSAGRKVVDQEQTASPEVESTNRAHEHEAAVSPVSVLIPEMPIDEQIRQLPDATESEAAQVKETEELHHSIKVDQLALKLQSLSSEWDETKDQVHYHE